MENIMKVPIDEAEGEVLNAAIKNAQGTVILPAGISITAALMSALHQQGIVEVDIISADMNAENEKRIAVINSSFAPFSGPHMKELNICLVTYLTPVS
jgi:hypothetical protein